MAALKMGPQITVMRRKEALLVTSIAGDLVGATVASTLDHRHAICITHIYIILLISRV